VTKIILLNGPPRVGKDTAASILRKAAAPGTLAVIGFAHHLKRMVHGIYLGHAGWALDPNYFDAVKSEPQEFLAGMSWRQAYIHYSEQVTKPLHGKEWFGEMFVRAARESGCGTVVVPDSGFREEAERVVREFGPDNVLLVKIHREGITFDGDSRSYIDLVDLGVDCWNIINVTDDMKVVTSALLNVCAPWIEREK
jgi:hypothetical protein